MVEVRGIPSKGSSGNDGSLQNPEASVPGCAWEDFAVVEDFGVAGCSAFGLGLGANSESGMPICMPSLLHFAQTPNDRRQSRQ